MDGIDAHKKDLFVAMLIDVAPTPVTWQLANEPGAVRRIVRKFEMQQSAPVHQMVTRRGHAYAGSFRLSFPGWSKPVPAIYFQP